MKKVEKFVWVFLWLLSCILALNNMYNKEYENNALFIIGAILPYIVWLFLKKSFNNDFTDLFGIEENISTGVVVLFIIFYLVVRFL